MMKNQKLLYLFLAEVAGLYILWQFTYYVWLSQDTDLEMWLTSYTAHASTGNLNFMGYHTNYIALPDEAGA